MLSGWLYHFATSKCYDLHFSWLPIFFFFSHDNRCVVVFCMQGCVLSFFSHVRLCATLWTAACQASLSMGFSRQEYWSGLPSPLQEIFLTQGLNLCLLCLPALATGFFTTSATWEAQWYLTKTLICISIKEWSECIFMGALFFAIIVSPFTCVYSNPLAYF